jgi:hypothetical protein
MSSQMAADERALFAEAVEQAVASGGGPEGLDQLGWEDALAAEPQLAVSALFEALGRHGAGLDGLDRLLRHGFGVASGLAVLPGLGQVGPPGTPEGGRVQVGAGLAVDAAGEELHVPVADAAGRVALHRVPRHHLEVRDVGGLDPGLGLVELSGSAAPTGAGDPIDWSAVTASAQRALAHQLVGASGTMLDLARTHALDRVQFGVPIASFQAVRHRLAESLVAIEAARSALDAAWDEGDPFTAMVAKAVAGRSARTVAKHAQQVLAGIGFTAEHDFHRYLRRTRLLDALFGDARTLTHQIGARLLADRQMPPILPL